MESKEKRDKILIVDDDKSVRDFLAKFFKLKGYTEVQSVATGSDCIDIIGKEDIGIILLDIKLPKMSGIDILKEVKKIKPGINVIMITGFPEVDTAKEALKLGAYDYIVKPFDLAYLELCVFSKITAAKNAQ